MYTTCSKKKKKKRNVFQKISIKKKKKKKSNVFQKISIKKKMFWQPVTGKRISFLAHIYTTKYQEIIRKKGNNAF